MSSLGKLQKPLFPFFLIGFVFLNCSCQSGYLIKMAWHQSGILLAQKDLDEVIKDPSTDEKTRAKLELVKEVRHFAASTLGLKVGSNYSRFVKLTEDYPSYVVSASPKDELKNHLWWFPIVGHLPYKGYPTLTEAKGEAEELKEQGLDVFVRGVSAYSTLGFLSDPVLSSMLLGEDSDLVNVIIHESVHATIFIGSEAEFNENLATFIGDLGTELFYAKKNPELVKKIQDEKNKTDLFLAFVKEQIKKLEIWYGENKGAPDFLSRRAARLQQIQTEFLNNMKPQLGEELFAGFSKGEMNNARLMLYKTYHHDTADFLKLYELSQKDFAVFLKHILSLKDAKNPQAALRELLQRLGV